MERTDEDETESRRRVDMNSKVGRGKKKGRGKYEDGRTQRAIRAKAAQAVAPLKDAAAREKEKVKSPVCEPSVASASEP